MLPINNQGTYIAVGVLLCNTRSFTPAPKYPVSNAGVCLCTNELAGSLRDTGYFRQREKQFDQCVSFWQATTANCEKYRFLSLWKATHNICSRALEVLLGRKK